jgi:hypothetical protein
MTKPTTLAIQDNKIFIATENSLYQGWAPAEGFSLVPKPVFHWKKAKIPFDLWCQITTFLRWTQAEHKEEAMATFFYNVPEDKWAVEVFPQKPMGMSVRQLEDHADYKVLRAKYGNGWVQAGSIHHHCNTKAFQSGTDHADETNRDGVHITLGEMLDAELDTHVRVSFDGLMYQSDLSEWIEPPAWWHEAPKFFKDYIDENVLFALANDAKFPDEWKTRIIKWVAAPGSTVLTNGQTDWYARYGNVCGYGGYQSETVEVKKNEPAPANANGADKTTASTSVDAKAFALMAELSERIGFSFTEIHDSLSLSEAEVEEMTADETNVTELQFREIIIEELEKAGINPAYAQMLLARVL